MVNPTASAACRICGASVTMLEAPLHIEDHRQAGDLDASLTSEGHDDSPDQGVHRHDGGNTFGWFG